MTPKCPYCGRPTRYEGMHKDPSAGLQTTEFTCYSLNPHHKVYITETIPGFEVIERPDSKYIRSKIRLTAEKKAAIRKMLNDGVSPVVIAAEMDCSHHTVYKMKRVVMEKGA